VATISDSIPLVLYGTSACHLCEQALALLQDDLLDGCRLSEVDISESDELMARYGLTIPVLRRMDTGSELNWPFDRAAVVGLLGGSAEA